MKSDDYDEYSQDRMLEGAVVECSSSPTISCLFVLYSHIGSRKSLLLPHRRRATEEDQSLRVPWLEQCGSAPRCTGKKSCVCLRSNDGPSSFPLSVLLSRAPLFARSAGGGGKRLYQGQSCAEFLLIMWIAENTWGRSTSVRPRSLLLLVTTGCQNRVRTPGNSLYSRRCGRNEAPVLYY